MSMRYVSIAVVGAVLALLTIMAASAATKKKPASNEPPNTPMTKCMTEVGARWDGYQRGWWWVGGAGNPQEQAYYDCLDRIANPQKKKR